MVLSYNICFHTLSFLCLLLSYISIFLPTTSSAPEKHVKLSVEATALDRWGFAWERWLMVPQIQYPARQNYENHTITSVEILALKKLSHMKVFRFLQYFFCVCRYSYPPLANEQLDPLTPPVMSLIHPMNLPLQATGVTVPPHVQDFREVYEKKHRVEGGRRGWPTWGNTVNGRNPAPPGMVKTL